MFLLFLSCNEYNFNEFKNDNNSLSEDYIYPLIQVTPTELDFGTNTYFSNPPEKIFSVTNIGEGTLSLYDLYLDNSNGGFFFTSVSELELEPSESLDFIVYMFTETQGDFSGQINISSNDPFDAVSSVNLTGKVNESLLEVTPPSHEFGIIELGQSSQVPIQITNVGDMSITIDELAFQSTSPELQLINDISVYGSFPMTLIPMESTEVFVQYTPTDDVDDSSTVTVFYDGEQQSAYQYGTSKYFEGFSSGWYVYDDGVAYETTSNPSYVVENYGDLDSYWYEPSGAHGLVGSSDPVGDYAIMRQYVLDHAGPPIQVNGPFNFQSNSVLSTFSYATFTYIMCDFYLDPSIDVSRYEISGGLVDDGMQIMLNGFIIGHRKLGDSNFSYPLQNAIPGQVNTLIMILVDNSAVDKYVNELAFTLDGQMVP